MCMSLSIFRVDGLEGQAWARRMEQEDGKAQADGNGAD
jgi:hypothetical protein